MSDIIISTVLVIFPIMMYLVFSCYNVFINKKLERIMFIVTIITSLYVSVSYNIGNYEMLIFCNIPILICYFKREWLLGLFLSLIVVLYSYLIYDIDIVFTIIKCLSYLMTYMFLYNRKTFKYLFFKISAVIQGFFISFEYFVRTNNDINRVIELLIYIFIIYGLTFFCLYLFKLADDITSLYLMVNKVKEESKLKNALFKLTHEIKNPIAVCKGYLDMMDIENVDKSRRYIDIIKTEIDRSLNVIADFMEYSKIKINKEEFDMVMLLDEIYDSFNLLINNKDIRFNYHNKYEEVYLMGDFDRLKQVFINVIKNSIESIDKNGIIDIDLELEDNDVCVTVSDNGIGMTEEELSNMKEMFYTTKKDGTGLGVALSNEIIVAHDGKMDYYSEKNKGTRCVIKLPV